MGRHRLAVVPRDAGPHAEGPGQPVIRAFPGLGQGRLYFVGEPRCLRQPLKQVAQHRGGACVIGKSQVKRQGLGYGGVRKIAAVAADVILEPVGVLLQPLDDLLLGLITIVRARCQHRDAEHGDESQQGDSRQPRHLPGFRSNLHGGIVPFVKPGVKDNSVCRDERRLNGAAFSFYCRNSSDCKGRIRTSPHPLPPI